MISFNSNSSLFRVSFNFVNTCYFFVICSFSPKKHHYKENLRDGTNLSTMTEHPVPNAVSPRRFHCIPFVLVVSIIIVVYVFSAQNRRPPLHSNCVSSRIFLLNEAFRQYLLIHIYTAYQGGSSLWRLLFS